jgi:hypothetical protein
MTGKARPITALIQSGNGTTRPPMRNSKGSMYMQ